MRLLIIEDDAKAARVLRRGLEEEGFVVDVAHTGEMGAELAQAGGYEAVILDWLLPGKDGLTVCRELRAARVPAPILMLTARDGLEQRVTGLNSGADDYLTKPFAFEELLARVRALLRRPPVPRAPVLRVGDLALDPATQRVTRGRVEIPLTPKEFAILEILIRHAGEVVTRRRLGEAVWQDDPEDLTNLLDVHVSHLRRKIDSGRGPTLLETVRGRGFRLGPP